ncbi:MAG: 4Fe-4S binding protein [Deltaproteobacteria bacterium]|nr:4Fe-4S binding protein [Deltaproteobacteria bacterium]
MEERMYVINDECVACGTCAEECPEDAISESGDVYVIDQEKCIECGACVDVCPTDAIDEK